MTELRHFETLIAAADRLFIGADGRGVSVFFLTVGIGTVVPTGGLPIMPNRPTPIQPEKPTGRRLDRNLGVKPMDDIDPQISAYLVINRLRHNPPIQLRSMSCA
jgi:hypothetical protein